MIPFSVFAGSSGRDFAEKISRCLSIEVSSSEMLRYSGGNTFVRINETVRDRDVFLIQPIGNDANNEFTEILFWLDAFKRANAHRCVLVMPCFSYAEGDSKTEPRISIRARVCAGCMELAGSDSFITMDLHAPQVQGFFKKPMDHLYALPLFAELIRHIGLEDYVIVAPSMKRLSGIHTLAGILDAPIAINNANKEQMPQLIGNVSGKTAIIVDDYAISGGTLTRLSENLMKNGAKKVYTFLTHALFSDTGIRRILDSPIERVYVTDTVYNEALYDSGRFGIVSAAPLFAEAIRRYYLCESIDSMSRTLPERVFEKALTMGHGI